jgi:tetratricopeptide (TPR) repeat protein
LGSEGEERVGAGSGGGAAGSGGYDFQARALAYIAAYIVAARRLDWLRDREDTPIALAAETGGAGDDIRIEFAGWQVEAQAKRGLNLTRLRDVVAEFARSLAAQPGSDVLLVVDDTSSKTIRSDLRDDLRRIAQGRRDYLKPITREVLNVIARAGASDCYRVAGRMHIVDLPLEPDGAASAQVALGLLREVFRDEDHRKAWSILLNEGHRLQKERGRRDRSGLLSLLMSEQVRPHERAMVTSLPRPSDTQSPLVGTPLATEAGTSQPDPWQGRIDDAVKLIKAGQAEAARRLLEQIEAEAHGVSVPVRALYRVYTNLGACWVDLNQLANADAVLRKALDYEEADSTARVSLAQVRLALEDRAGAVQLAKAVLEQTPDSVEAWSVLIQASDEEIDEEQVPQRIRQAFQILASRGLSRYRRGDRTGSIDLLKQALKRRRDPQLLILLSEALFAVGVADDIERYLDEAIQALTKTDRTHLLEQALLLRGVVLTRRGEHERAKPFFESARQTPGHSWKADAALARNHLALGEPELALAMLAEVRAPEAKTEISLLKAFAEARLGRPERARGHIEAILDDPLNAEDQPDAFLGAAEAALQAGLGDLAETFLDRVGDDASDFRQPLLRARLQGGRGESSGAKAAYGRALEMVPPAQRRSLQFELGEYLGKIGEHLAAVAAFEQGGVDDAPGEVRRDYARALYQAGEASRVLPFLAEERSRGILPVWAVDLQARVALDREDWPGAIAALDDLRTKVPKHPWVALKLVEALLHEQQTDRAPSLLLDVIATPDTDADALMAAAHLLGEIGHPVEALDAAYRAVRLEPDNPQLRLAYLKAFLDAQKNGHPGLRPTVVGPGTWVHLRSPLGETRDCLITETAPADIQRSELLATDERASKLLGRTVGDRITFRPGALDESEFDVVEIKAATVRLFQETLTGFRVWFPENTNLQAFPVGEGRLDELVPIISSLQGRADFVNSVLELYEAKVLPLGMVAAALGASLRSVYNQRTGQPSASLFVEAGDRSSIIAAYDVAASGQPVVLTLTALLTWHRLDLLGLLPALFSRLVVPQSLLDELEREAGELADQAARGTGVMAWIDDRLVIREADPVWFAREQSEIKAIADWARANCQRQPRPLAALTAADDERRRVLGASSCDAVALAKDQAAVILADDFGLRRLARDESGVQGFSTFAALQLANDRKRLDPAQLSRAATRLISLNHDFVQLWPEMLYLVLSDSNFEVTPETVRVFDRLRGGRSDTDSAIRVGVSVLRQVALSVAGEAVLEAIAALCYESLSLDRGDDVFRTITTELRRQTILLPLIQDRLIRALKGFVAARVLGRSRLI